jgi:hypothetical protein
VKSDFLEVAFVNAFGGMTNVELTTLFLRLSLSKLLTPQVVRL